jgi:hypothetical protein
LVFSSTTTVVAASPNNLRARRRSEPGLSTALAPACSRQRRLLIEAIQLLYQFHGTVQSSMDRAVTIAFNDWLYAKADADAKFVPPLLYLLGELEIHPDRLVHPRLYGWQTMKSFFASQLVFSQQFCVKRAVLQSKHRQADIPLQSIEAEASLPEF